MTTPFLLFGSYSYTGSLIADLVVRRGMYPILSRRDSVRLKVQAVKLGLEYRSTNLDDQATLKVLIRGVSR